jgi:hypothetical protein
VWFTIRSIRLTYTLSSWQTWLSNTSILDVVVVPEARPVFACSAAIHVIFDIRDTLEVVGSVGNLG